MMKTDVDGLMTFLNENAKSDEAKALVAEQEPLLRRLAGIAESGRWPLAKNPDRERLARLAVDVAILTGRTGLRCVVVSASRLFPELERMSEMDYWGDSLGSVLGDRLREILSPSLRASLRANLWASAWTGSLHNIVDDFEDRLRGILSLSLTSSLWSSLYFCLGFALFGDREKTKRLARVVGAFADGVMPFICRDDVIFVLKA